MSSECQTSGCRVCFTCLLNKLRHCAVLSLMSHVMLEKTCCICFFNSTLSFVILSFLMMILMYFVVFAGSVFVSKRGQQFSLSLLPPDFICVCFSAQVRPPDHDARGGAEAPEGPLHKRPSLRSVLLGLLGVVGQTRTAVLAVPVPVRWLPHSGGPPPQRPAGRPCRVRLRPHAPQLPLLRFQCSGLHLCVSVLLLLGQREFLLLPSLLCDSGSFFHLGLFVRLSVATASFPKGSASETGRDAHAQRVRVF